MATSRSTFRSGLWDDGHPLQRSKVGRRLLFLLQVGAFAWKSFVADELILRATALAYATILAIVPLLAVAFSVFAAFPALNDAYETLRTVIYQYLTPTASQTIVDSLDSFIAKIHSGAMAGVGVAFLFIAVIMLLGAIEYSFNRIFSVRKSRKLLDRIVYYVAIIMVGPMLVGLSLRTFVRSIIEGYGYFGLVEHGILHDIWSASASILTSILAIAVLYVVIPNTKVSWRAALAGGAFAGVLFELAKKGYTFYVTNIINYSAIYGAVGAIPVFIVWIYLIWIVVLFGGEFAYAWQNVDVHKIKLAHSDTSQSYREWLAASICVDAVRRFDGGRVGPSVEDIVDTFAVPQDLAGEILDRLGAAGIIADSVRGHLPARDPRLVTLADVLRALRNGFDTELRKHGDPVVTTAIDALEENAYEPYRQVSLEELAKAEGIDRLLLDQAS